MTLGDVDVRITAASATDIDTAVTAQTTIMGVSGSYMCCSIGPENQQVVLIAIQRIA